MHISTSEKQPALPLPSQRNYALFLAFSFVVHAFLYWTFAKSNLPDAHQTSPLRGTNVELIPAAQFKKLVAKPIPEEQLSPSFPQAPSTFEEPQDLVNRTQESPKETISTRTVVHDFQLSRLLALPENKKLQESLPLFDPADVQEQLCNLEVMEQIQIADKNYRPERVVAFAFEHPQVSGDQIKAQGAAFRSEGSWFKLQYSCTFNALTNLVTAMDFIVGEVIPHSDWEMHFLFAD